MVMLLMGNCFYIQAAMLFTITIHHCHFHSLSFSQAAFTSLLMNIPSASDLFNLVASSSLHTQAHRHTLCTLRMQRNFCRANICRGISFACRVYLVHPHVQCIKSTGHALMHACLYTYTNTNIYFTFVKKGRIF